MVQVHLSMEEYELFKSYIESKCGITLGGDKAYLVESRLSKLVFDLKAKSFHELYTRICSNQNPELAQRVIDAITTNETSWFRDGVPWTILGELLMPRYIEKLRRGAPRIRIWSAAASTGQEAYSTALFIHDYLAKHEIRDIVPERFEIVATDISQTVLEQAAKGRFDSISIMRGLDRRYREQYFTNHGSYWELSEQVRSMVSFQWFNLQNSFARLGRFDLVLLRYVLIYFGEAFRSDIFHKMMSAVGEDGVLMIGTSEYYPALDRLWRLQQQSGGVYYSLDPLY